MTVIANTKLFNVRNSLQYYQPIQDVSNNQFYIFAGRHLPWPNTAPLAITESVTETEYTIFEELIFGKLVTSDDVKLMIDRYDSSLRSHESFRCSVDAIYRKYLSSNL